MFMPIDPSSFIQGLRQFFAKRKRITTLGAIFVILTLFILFRGCRASPYPSTVYHIAESNRWDNLNLMGKDRSLMAFSRQLLSAIASTQNMQVVLSIVPANNLLPRLEAGQFDGVITFMSPTPILEENLIFSDPFFLWGPVLVLPEESPYMTREEIKHKIIGISSHSSVFLDLGQDPTLRLQLYDNMLNALADLDNHHIDGVVLPAIQAYVYTHTFYPGRLKVATSPLNHEGLRVVALKNEKGEQLIEEFNEGLATLKQNGTYDKLIDAWDLIDPEKIDRDA